MKLPKYVNLFDTPVNEKKHAGQLNYQRVNDLLSEFDAVEIGEIIAAGFIYEIYGIELDLADDETKDLFPHLQDRACRTQYRQILIDFDVNSKSYDDRIEKNRRAANIRWHGKGGKVQTEPKEESKDAPAPEDDDEGMTEEEWNRFLVSAETKSKPKSAHDDSMSEAQLRSFLLEAKRHCSSFDEYRDYVLTALVEEKITVKDKIMLLELGRKGAFEQ